MRAYLEQSRSLITMNRLEGGNGEPMSVGAFVRQWGPAILAAVVVPGGILIPLVILVTRWNQRRLALATSLPRRT